MSEPILAKPLTQIQKLSETTENVLNRITSYVNEQKLHLPIDYSAGNALRQLQLIVQENEKLMNCTQSSIAKMALQMCILGLNPVKTQCYAIPYGNEAKLFVSYFGKEAIAKRIDPNIEKIIAKSVRKGEVFEWQNEIDGTYTILNHQQTLESLDSKEFIGGYATIFYKNGKKPVSQIMTWKKICDSWKKSSARPFDEKGNLKVDSTHAQYTEDMIERTLINRILKPLINTSSDNDLFGDTLKEINFVDNVDIENDSNYLEIAQDEAQDVAIQKTATGDFIDIPEQIEFTEVPNNN